MRIKQSPVQWTSLFVVNRWSSQNHLQMGRGLLIAKPKLSNTRWVWGRTLMSFRRLFVFSRHERYLLHRSASHPSTISSPVLQLLVWMSSRSERHYHCLFTSSSSRCPSSRCLWFFLSFPSKFFRQFLPWTFHRIYNWRHWHIQTEFTK